MRAVHRRRLALSLSCFLALLNTGFAQESLLLQAAGKGAEALLQSDRGKWPIHQLEAGDVWQLNLPLNKEFDASGLLLLTNGTLLTHSDRGPTLYTIELKAGTNSANLTPLSNLFAPSQLQKYAREKYRYYDCEGVAQDAQGRFYICEEADRWILRCDPLTGDVQRLDIDWSPVKSFFSSDRNASFEGIAIGGNRLYVANERSNPVIIVVDLPTLKITDHFQVFPRTPSFLGTHYSDLCWFENKLWVLCRQHRVILEVDPENHRILSEYDYGNVEASLGYRTQLPVGIMEGLAVSRDVFWLVTDNNGMPRNSAPRDIRPSLLRLKRPQ
jgi:hypothetical protein